MRGEDVANSAKPGQKGHDRHGVEPREAAPNMGHSVTGHATADQPAGVVPPMKRQVPFEWQMDVSRTAKERQHAEREAHDETEKIKISPDHRTPRAHPMRELEFETQTLQLSFAAALAADAFLVPAALLPRTQNFSQPVSQAWCTENLRQQQHGLA